MAVRAHEPPPRRLSLDEAHRRRGQQLATIVSDPQRRRVIEVLDGRSQRVVASYLYGRGQVLRSNSLRKRSKVFKRKT